jgi:pyruvate/2-oxoglutarate dehydrogenase complex dihydrolipoamide acyltransferase (E2) component
MPKLGAYTEDMLVSEWLVAEGAQVAQGMPLFVLESDKTTLEVEAESDGYLHQLAAVGALVPIGAQVGVVASTLDEYRALAAVEVESPRAVPAAPAISATRPSAHEPAADGVAAPPLRGSRRRPGLPMISPRARALLAARGLPIEECLRIAGTGPGGRIVHRDVAAHVAQAWQVDDTTSRADELEVAQRIPLRGARGTIARRMVESLQVAAQLTSIVELDVSPVVDLRRRARVAGEGPGLGVTAIFVGVVAEALRRHPRLNARVVGDEIEVLADVNVGVAVETPAGVFAPVVHRADRLSMRQISARIAGLAERARAGTLERADVAGATFTLSNGGIHPVDMTTAILNPPQVAILWIGRIRDRPAVTPDGGIAVRPTLQACLTFDHRAVDGGPAAALLGTIDQLIRDLGARDADDAGW